MKINMVLEEGDAEKRRQIAAAAGGQDCNPDRQRAATETRIMRSPARN